MGYDKAVEVFGMDGTMERVTDLRDRNMKKYQVTYMGQNFVVTVHLGGEGHRLMERGDFDLYCRKDYDQMEG